jgi:hypothetical protein
MPNEPERLIDSKINCLLMIDKGGKNKKILSVFGATPEDFGHGLSLSSDDDGVTVLSDPSVMSSEMIKRLMHHRCLVEFESDSVEGPYVWTFQWPRDITGYRHSISNAFPELEDSDLWGCFLRSWNDITKDMGEARTQFRLDPAYEADPKNQPWEDDLDGLLEDAPAKKKRGRPRGSLGASAKDLAALLSRVIELENRVSSLELMINKSE